jgi:hypothetical protein
MIEFVVVERLETIIIDLKQKTRGSKVVCHILTCDFEVESLKFLLACLIRKWRGELNYNGVEFHITYSIYPMFLSFIFDFEVNMDSNVVFGIYRL